MTRPYVRRKPMPAKAPAPAAMPIDQDDAPRRARPRTDIRPDPVREPTRVATRGEVQGRNGEMLSRNPPLSSFDFL